MKTFLQELAEEILASGNRPEQYTLIFPNRRAALYFQYHLAVSLKKPAWAPRLTSIEEFLKSQSDLKEPDKLTLIHRLHAVYQEAMGVEESFDRFYFWGDMLLRDFDEIDKYMVNASQLFKDLSKVKELDNTFDYLTEEQKEYLKEFWSHVADPGTENQKKFLTLWKKLPSIYQTFTKALRKDGLAYEGMIHRDVADIYRKKPPQDASTFVFAGFNALTKAEAVIITAMVERGAKVVWDHDAWYMNDLNQEAGQFLRQYRDHTLLGKTLQEEAPRFIQQGNKKINLTGVALKIGQAKMAGELVREILKKIPAANQPVELAKTVIVLPDESLLLPILHSMPEELKDINVTMGFPLKDTPLFSLLNLMIEMQVRQRRGKFNHREVHAILTHPYVRVVSSGKSEEIHRTLLNNNRIAVDPEDIEVDDPILRAIFTVCEPQESTRYLIEVVELLGVAFTDRKSFDREYCFHFYQHLVRLQTVMTSSDNADWRGYQKLFRQIVQFQKIPFSGEPLRGLQIMGVLETRNLDFDNVIILSLNEGFMPSGSTPGSYVPYAVKKAYGLPTHEHRDAMYAYLFYRLLQRSEHVWMLYSTEPDIVGNGEVSRFVQQMLFEWNDFQKVDTSILHNPVHVYSPRKIIVEKTDLVRKQLEKYLVGNARNSKLSPTSLNDYVTCSLRFYFKYLAELRDHDLIEDDIDPRIFGQIVHDSMHELYANARESKTEITADWIDTNRKRVPELVVNAFRRFFKLNTEDDIEFVGQRELSRALAVTMIESILDKDAEHAPFRIELLEEEVSWEYELPDGRKIAVGGKIDRTDVKGQMTRIVDYKTGADQSTVKDVDQLFTDVASRNKAAFQLLIYAVIYNRKFPSINRLVPGLYARKSLATDEPFGLDFTGNQPASNDVRVILPGFEDQLKATVNQLFDTNTPFAQTSIETNCEYCSFNKMCRRAPTKLN